MPLPDRLPQHNDVALHEELSSQERVDAILNSSHLTTDQAVAALDAQYQENQGTFPHVVITKAIVESTPAGPRDHEYRAYYGPFANRREAEAWAKQRFAGIDRVTWEVAKILTAELDAREAQEFRRILGHD